MNKNVFHFICRLRLLLALVACLAAHRVAADEDIVITNPLNISYRFYNDKNTPVHRTTADPVIVLYHDDYYLFASHSSGYWYSHDLRSWTYVRTQTLLTAEAWAPAVFVYDDAIYYLGMGEERLFRSTDPKNDKWEDVPNELPTLGDPAFFLDNDGRVYAYYGLSAGGYIYGFEVDPKQDWKVVSPVVELIPNQGNRFGWEVPGDNNEKTGEKGWNEGACITRQGDWYYLMYATPGTEYTSYCSGVYVSKSPLGPYTPMDGAPFASKPTGFITGGGHGHPFVDRYGNQWYVATLIVGVREHFERRVGIFPAYYTPDGYGHAIMFEMDKPFRLPGQKVDFSTEDLSLGMNLLSHGKTMTASSSLNSKMRPVNAADDDVRTWWSASSGRSGQWLRMDLGRTMNVEALQVCFADEGFKSYRQDTDIPVYKYIVEGSVDGSEWHTVLDRSQNTEDQIYELVVLPESEQVRYLRVTNKQAFSVGQFSVSDLRVFGHADGPLPGTCSAPAAERSSADFRRISFSWDAATDAEGYILRWGTRPDRMNHAARIWGTEVTFGCFDAAATYYVSVTPFNESGKGTPSDVTEVTGASGGLQSDAEGTYFITKPQDLLDFASLVNNGATDANALMTADLDMTGLDFTPIGGTSATSYQGTFDGGGHTIDNLLVEAAEKEGVGIFGYAGGATIKNLICGPGNNIRGKAFVGGLVGDKVTSGTLTIIACGHEGNVNCSAQNGAAFVGCVHSGNLIINHCYNTGTVRGGRESAIFSGWFSGSASSISHSYNSGKLTAGADGTNYLWRSSPTVEDVYDISGRQSTTRFTQTELESGALAWKLNGNKAPGIFRQNLDDGEPDSHPVSSQLHGIVYASGTIKCNGTAASGTTLSFSNTDQAEYLPHSYDEGICSVCGEPDAEYLYPNQQGYYPIETPYALRWFAAYVASNPANASLDACLTADINMKGIDFVGIGSLAAPYCGEFDGGMHTIDYLTIKKTGQNCVGFINAANTNASIHDLTLGSHCTISGYRYVGGIVGHIGGQDGDIIRLERLGFEGTLNVHDNAGGIVGCIPNNNITALFKSCYSIGKVTGTQECGALSGWSSNARLTNCFARVNGAGFETGHDVARGFTPTFRNCYVNGGQQRADGLGTFTLTEMRNGTLLEKLNDPAFQQTVGTDTCPKLRGQGQE